MPSLRDILGRKIPVWAAERREMISEHGDTVVSDVTLAQVHRGMRGVKSLLCNTSYVDPVKGLIIRGIPIMELTDRLPEEVFFLLLTGEPPDSAALAKLQREFSERADVPTYVWDVLEAMPHDSHPMTMLNLAILSMQRESKFRKAYDSGVKKPNYWVSTLEDALNLLAKLPGIAAGIYRMRYKKGPRIERDPDLDWGGNFARMLGAGDDDPVFADMIRLYLTLHCDHEGGNVSAFTCHVVNSALSDLYYAVSAGLNGLAGPLHGLANQECLKFVLCTLERFAGVPDDEQLTQEIWDTLHSGKVIPGYGHSVLRATDPRFEAFRAFEMKHFPEDPVLKLVSRLSAVVPGVLKEHGRATSPWPNVDAASGALLYHYGMTEFKYYTVLFAVSRAMGLCAQAVISRGMMEPITRPKSVETDWLRARM
jgi:citrate synthase